MNIRQTLNDKPGLTTAVVSIVVVAAVIYIVYSLIPRGVPGIDYDWYSADDGKTWFRSPSGQYAPITTADGKEAFKVHVFRCGPTQFVGFLERWDAAGKKQVEEAKAKNQLEVPGAYKALADAHQEVRKPGGKEWVKMANPESARTVMRVACPDGADSTTIRKVYAQ